MFSNVLMTTLTPLCNTDEISCWQNQPFTSIWPEDQLLRYTTRTVHQPKNTELKKTIKKKKRKRTAFNSNHLKHLEETYCRTKYITKEHRIELARTLNIGERCIKIWFQNRRMKEKKESFESTDSSSEAISLEETPPRPLPTEPQSLPTATPLQNMDFYHGNPEVELSTPYYYPYPDVAATKCQINENQCDYTCQNFTNISCNPPESESTVASMLPPPEPFANNRDIYPTSYYPTLVEYFMGERFKDDSDNVNGNINSTELQWSGISGIE